MLFNLSQELIKLEQTVRKTRNDVLITLFNDVMTEYGVDDYMVVEVFKFKTKQMITDCIDCIS